MPKRQRVDLDTFQARFTRVRASSNWLSIASEKSTTWNTYKKVADTKEDTVALVNAVAAAFHRGDVKVRVSQAYDQVGHTFGVRYEPSTSSIYVYDHMGDLIYSKRSYRQYNQFLNELKKTMRARNLVFAVPNPAKNRDRTYLECFDSGDGPCVYYFDKYVNNII